MLPAMHPEDVKAGIRKRFGSVAEFERQRNLPPKSVTEVLRGRAWKRVSDAIEAVLQEESPSSELSEVSGNSVQFRTTHRQNAAAR